MSKIALKSNGDLDSLLKSKFFESDNTVEDELTKNVATIGENLNIRRIEKSFFGWSRHNCFLCSQFSC